MGTAAQSTIALRDSSSTFRAGAASTAPRSSAGTTPAALTRAFHTGTGTSPRIGRMAERTSHAPGTFSYAELATSDVPAAKAFYTAIFGWDYDEQPLGDGQFYSMAKR